MYGLDAQAVSAVKQWLFNPGLKDGVAVAVRVTIEMSFTLRWRMIPLIDHIEITVRDMDVAVSFYDRLLPLLGFDLTRRTHAVIEAHEKRVVSYEHPRLGFAISSPLNALARETINRRKPGALHHLAFSAPSRADVDRLHVELQAIGATIVAPPREYPEYTPAGYYALYFKDLEGIKYEIVCTAQDGECR